MIQLDVPYCTRQASLEGRMCPHQNMRALLTPSTSGIPCAISVALLRLLSSILLQQSPDHCLRWLSTRNRSSRIAKAWRAISSTGRHPISMPELSIWPNYFCPDGTLNEDPSKHYSIWHHCRRMQNSFVRSASRLAFVLYIMHCL